MSNPLFNNDLLVTHEGNIDQAFLARSAKARAISLYGETCTTADIDFWADKLNSLAILQQAKFRDGLFARPALSEVA